MDTIHNNMISAFGHKNRYVKKKHAFVRATHTINNRNKYKHHGGKMAKQNEKPKMLTKMIPVKRELNTIA